MDEQRLNDQLEPIYNSSVLIQDIVKKTSQERWTIETVGERGSGKSVLARWHDDDYDDDIYVTAEITEFSFDLLLSSNVFNISLFHPFFSFI